MLTVLLIFVSIWVFPPISYGMKSFSILFDKLLQELFVKSASWLKKMIHSLKVFFHELSNHGARLGMKLFLGYHYNLKYTSHNIIIGHYSGPHGNSLQEGICGILRGFLFLLEFFL